MLLRWLVLLGFLLTLLVGGFLRRSRVGRFLLRLIGSGSLFAPLLGLLLAPLLRLLLRLALRFGGALLLLLVAFRCSLRGVALRLGLLRGSLLLLHLCCVLLSRALLGGVGPRGWARGRLSLAGPHRGFAGACRGLARACRSRRRTARSLRRCRGLGSRTR